jgi:hypothetical protein
VDTPTDEATSATLDRKEAAFDELRAEKAAKLTQLMKRKPGQKGYKRSLKAYLEADAKLDKVLMKRLRRAEQPVANAS